MKRTPQPTRLAVVIPLATSLIHLLTATCGQAANATWTGGGAPDGNWQNAANWGGTAPAALDFLLFDGSTQLETTNDFAAGTIFGNLAFSSGAGAFTLDGNGLVLTNPVQSASSSVVSGGDITNASTSAQIVSTPLTLSAGHHVATTLSGAGQLNLAGAFTRNAGGTLRFIKAGDNINFTGSGLANVNGILGGWALIGIGTTGSGDWAALDGSDNVIAYAGYVNKSGGSNMGLSSSGGNAADNIKINTRSSTPNTLNSTTAGTYDINSLIWSAGSPGGDQTLNLTSGQVMRLGANGGIININAGTRTFNVGNGSSGTITAGGAANTAGSITLAANPLDDKNQRLKINSAITDNGSGVVSVNMLGWIEMKMNSTYTGGTYVNRGRAQVNAFASSATSTGLGTGPIYVFPGAQVFFWDNGKTSVTVANNISLAGYGTLEDKGGALRLTGNAVTYTGTITLMGNASIAGTGTFGSGSKFTGPGGLIIGDNWNNGTVTLNSSTASDYSGDTTINNPTASGNNNLVIGSASLNNILPHGAGKGNVVLVGNSGSSWAEFDLKGSTQTINGLSNTGANAANTWVKSSAGNGTLVVGDNDATSTFGGVLQNGGGTLALTKIGNGTLTLANANTYSGITTISAGTLALSGSGSIANTPRIIVSSDGTFDVSALASLTLGASQTLTNSASTATLKGNIDASSGQLGLAFASGTPSFTVLDGALTLATGTTVTIDNTGAELAPGTYTVITAGTGGSVGGTAPSSVTVTGGGASGPASLQIDGDELQLVVISGPAILSATAAPSSVTRFQSTLLSVTVTNGAPPYAVNVDASSVGGSPSVALVRDTSHPAEVYVYTNSITPSGAANGGYLLPVTVADDNSVMANGNISLTVFAASLVWDGDAGGDSFWDTSSAAWQGGAVYQAGDFVRFDDTAAANPNVTNVNLTTTLSPGSVTVSNTAGSATAQYTFGGTGKISGSAGLTKEGSGALIVNNSAANDYTGGTLIAGGVLQLGNNDANGAISGPITNHGTLVFNRSDSALTHSASISGTGTLINNGDGTVTLTANNAFAGGATINNGTLRVNPVSGGNSALGTGDTIVNTNGTLVGGGGDAFGYLPNNSPSNIVINGGTVTGLGSPNYRITMPNVIFTNGGTLTSAAGNTGDGSGNYSFRGDGATCTVTVHASSTTATISGNGVSCQSPTTFDVALGSAPGGVDLSVTASVRPFGSQPLIKAGAGKMTLSGTNTYTGPTAISDGTLAITGSGRLGSSGTYAGNITNDATFLYESALDQILSGALSGAGTVVKAGSSALRLSAANSSFSGSFTVNAGVLRADNAGAFNGRPITVTTDGATIYHNTGATYGGDYSIVGYGVLEGDPGNSRLGAIRLAGASTLAGTITLTGDAGITPRGGNTHTISGQITGGYGLRLGRTSTSTSAGAGTIILSNPANDWTGDTRLEDGTVRLGASGVIPSGSGRGNVVLANPGTGFHASIANTVLDLNGNNQTINGLSNAVEVTGSDLAKLVITNSSATAATLTVGDTDAEGSYGGLIRGGNLGLTKIGNGTLTLGGANTYGGDTLISGGTLALSGAGSIAGSANILVATGASLDVSAVSFTLGSGQTLRGGGTIAGAVTVNGTIAPGASIGTLTFNDAPTLAGTIIAEVDRNGGTPLADKIVFAGGATFGGTLTLTNIGATLQSGDTFDLFDGSLSGAFATLNLPGGASHWNTASLATSGEIVFNGNSTPVASNFTLGVAIGGSANVNITGKYATDADAGDVLTITSVSVPANGTLEIVGGTNLVYVSTNTAASDSFTYTVSDGLESATGTVTVQTYNPQGFNLVSGPTPLGGGQYEIGYLGIPGEDYAIDETDDLTPPITWTPIVTNTASGTGAITFTVTPTAYPSGFFRTRHVPQD